MAKNRLGRFFSNVFKGAKKNSMAGVAEGVGNAVFGSMKEVAFNVFNKVDDRNFTEEEKARHELMKLEMEKQFELIDIERRKLGIKAQEIDAEVKIAAMDMYKNDSSLQKKFATFFLIGFSVFIGLRLALYSAVLFFDWNVNEFVAMGVADLSAVFSAVIFTMKDFLFGGSSSTIERDSKILEKTSSASVNVPPKTKTEAVG